MAMSKKLAEKLPAGDDSSTPISILPGVHVEPHGSLQIGDIHVIGRLYKISYTDPKEIAAELVRLLPQLRDISSFDNEVIFNRACLLSVEKAIKYLQDEQKRQLKSVMSDSYIPLDVSDDFISVRRYPFAEKLSSFLHRDNRKCVLLLLGDAGGGKSLTLKQEAYRLWQEYQPGQRQPIPLWIRLSACAHPTKELVETYLKELLPKLLRCTKEDADWLVHQLIITQPWLLLLDGFDEMPDKRNLYRTNRWHEDRWHEWWPLKVIISCRTQSVVGVDSHYKSLFVPNTEDILERWDLFDQIIIKPFSTEQIAAYVRVYCQRPRSAEKVLQAPWDDPAYYLEKIQQTPGLENLLQNPFLLSVMLDHLPKLVTENVRHLDRYHLLEKYVMEHIKREFNKIAATTVLSQREFEFELIAFSETLATLMFSEKVRRQNINWQSGINHIHYYPNEVKNPWKRFFDAEDTTYADWQKKSGLLLEDIKTDEEERVLCVDYQFRHKVLLEYFVLQVILHQIKGCYSADASASEIPSTEKLRDLLLNQKRFNAETDLLKGLAKRLKNAEEQQHLLGFILASKERNDITLLAANAATILNRQKFNFAGLDLSGAKLAGADMRSAIFDTTNLQRSDLRGVRFHDCFLHRTLLQGSYMHGVQFGQKPYVQLENTIRAITCSPDGREIAIAVSDYIEIYNLIMQEFRIQCRGHTNKVVSIAYDPSGKRIVSGSYDGTVRQWLAETGEQLTESHGHEGGVFSVAYDPTSLRIVSGSYDKTVRQWSAETGESLMKSCGHISVVVSVAYNHSGQRIVSGSRDTSVRQWSAETGEQLSENWRHEDSVNSVAYDPSDTRIVSGSNDGTIRQWSAETGEQLTEISEHGREVTSVAYDPSGTRIVSGNNDGTVRQWLAETGAQLSENRGHTSSVMSVAYDHSGRCIVSGSSDRTVRQWLAETGAQLSKSRGHTNGVTSVAYGHSGQRIVSGSSDCTVRQWIAETGVQLSEYRGHTDGVTSVAYGHSGRRIVSGSSDKTVRQWSAETGVQLSKSDGHERDVICVAYDPSGTRIVSGSYTSHSDTPTMWQWLAETGERLTESRGYTKGIFSVAYDPSGSRIVSGGDYNAIYQWSAETGEQLNKINWHRDISETSVAALSVTYNSSGTRIVSGNDDKTVRQWSAETGEQLSESHGHTYIVTSVAYDPNDRYIVSSSSDGTVRLWSAETGEQLHETHGHINGVSSVVYSPDGCWLASGSADHSIQVWRLSPTVSGLPQMHLHWRTHDYLIAWSAHLDGVIGLSPDNAKLLAQHKAIGTPQASALLSSEEEANFLSELENILLRAQDEVPVLLTPSIAIKTQTPEFHLNKDDLPRENIITERSRVSRAIPWKPLLIAAGAASVVGAVGFFAWRNIKGNSTAATHSFSKK